MYSLLFLGCVALVLALVLTPVVKYLAWRFGMVDQPDQDRKIHTTPIPRLGGVAVFASVLGAFGSLLIVRLSSGAIIWEGLPLVLRLLPAVSIVFCIGLADDLFGLRPWIKLVAEVVAGALAWSGGVHVGGIGGFDFSNVVCCAITLLWIVACTNAINLIDGVDGLASGVSLFAMLTMVVAASLNHNFPMALAVVPFAGALLGFLRYNFNPASIFLGDCGSLTLGFVLGCYGAVWSEKSSTLLGLTAPLLVLAIPLLDTGLAIARRLLNGHHIFAADRSHIHHKLLSRGFTPRRLVLILYGCCGIGATASLLLTVGHERNRDFVIVLFCLAAWLGLQHLGYNEFGTARRVVLGGTFRTVLSAQLALEAFERELRTDVSIMEFWELLCRTCPKFGFSGLELLVDNSMHQSGDRSGWQARIDLPNRGHLSLWRASGAKSLGAAAVLFVDSVSRNFQKRLSEIETSHHN